jgi:hypothetical protein
MFRLFRLNLSHNELASVAQLATCGYVDWLDVSHNRLRSLDGVDNMPRLKLLNASHNQLEAIPELQGLRRLTALILSDNRLTTLPRTDNWTELETLSLSGNRLTSLDWLTPALRKLRKLSLSHNRIARVDAELEPLEALSELRLNDNQLTAVPPRLAANRAINLLDLGNNRISDIAVLRVLARLPRLRNLNLRGNPVAALKSYREIVLRLVPQLRVLDGKRVSGSGLEKSRVSSRATAGRGHPSAESSDVIAKVEHEPHRKSERSDTASIAKRAGGSDTDGDDVDIGRGDDDAVELSELRARARKTRQGAEGSHGQDEENDGKDKAPPKSSGVDLRLLDPSRSGVVAVHFASASSRKRRAPQDDPPPQQRAKRQVIQAALVRGGAMSLELGAHASAWD